MLEQAWISITEDYRARISLHDAPDADHFTSLGGFKIYHIKHQWNGKNVIINIRPTPENSKHIPMEAFGANGANPLLSAEDTIAFLTSDPLLPIVLTGDVAGSPATFVIEKSHIYHDVLTYALLILAIVFVGMPLVITIGMIVIRRAEQKPITDLIQTINMMADDPTVTQQIPESIKNVKDFAELAQALELLQLNMVRTLQHRERLAEIGEAVAKINHDIRNVLSSATLVSDALLASDDENVRKSAPLVLRSLEQAVDLCQSMLDYLAQTPSPTYTEFDIVTLLEEVHSATLLDIDYSGPASMYADRGMMFRILLNLGRNAGTASATKLHIDVWRAGHLAICDISDNGTGIPKPLWPSLFSPFKNRQSSGGGLGLTIARDLALSQDGILKLSRSSDVGSEFRIQFKLNRFPDMGSDDTKTSWQSISIPTDGPVPAAPH
jgi:signal transduction histidine kinase